MPGGVKELENIGDDRKAAAEPILELSVDSVALDELNQADKVPVIRHTQSRHAKTIEGVRRIKGRDVGRANSAAVCSLGT